MNKSKWVGVLFSFLLPGMGTLYAQKFAKAIIYYLLFLLLLFSVRFIAYSFPAFVISVSVFLLSWLYVLISAYKDVDEKLEYKSVPYDQWYVYLSILVVHIGIFSLVPGPALDSVTPINFAMIPTGAMEPTLKVGDVLAHGKNKSVERNDIVVFWYPNDIKVPFIKRCIGLPGDSLAIRSGIVMIDDMAQSDSLYKFNHVVTTDGTPINQYTIEKYGIMESDYYQFNSHTYTFLVTVSQAVALRNLPFIIGVEPFIMEEGSADDSVYPYSETLGWNADHYGPIYIPKKGDRIALNDENIERYLKCIQFENDSVLQESAGLKINGQYETSYVFKESYYFMMGDNRHNSLDSRFWGLLPESLIIGKALYLYWGKDLERVGLSFD